MEKAIKKAEEGGYNGIQHGKVWSGIMTDTAKEYPQLALLDPLFWYYLGKAMDWDKLQDKRPLYLNRDGEYGEVEYWNYHWHRFIDNLASGGNAEDFFNDLLK